MSEFNQILEELKKLNNRFDALENRLDEMESRLTAEIKQTQQSVLELKDDVRYALKKLAEHDKEIFLLREGRTTSLR